MLALRLNISLDSVFITVTPNSVDIVTLCPKLSAPKLLFYFWMKLENLLGGNALYGFNDLAWAHRWNTLYQKMHVILVSPYLYKFNLISLRYLKANILQCLIHFFAKYNSTVFRRTYKMVEKY